MACTGAYVTTPQRPERVARAASEGAAAGGQVPGSDEYDEGVRMLIAAVFKADDSRRKASET